MIVVDNILISDDVVEKQFVCDLDKCKGGCCEDGDAGAPLEDEELKIIEEMVEKVKPYLSAAGLAEIEKKGKYVFHREFGWVTPTLPSDNEICVYATRDQTGMIKCAFEQAFYAGIIPWKKPISCHLFPIIIEKAKKGGYDRMNYEARPKLCNPACSLGKKLKVTTYEFLREPLVRKYGEAFYEALDKVAKMKAGKKATTEK
ncbi:MAG: DUF3109 family protein [Chitinophagaceae bacterium]|jgi:hypothetical protein|nr:DUF3109 family protein [Chitinophagaceae bacterium]